MTAGRKLKVEIVSAGLTIRDVARRAGIRYQRLSDYVNDCRDLSINEIQRVRQTIIAGGGRDDERDA